MGAPSLPGFPRQNASASLKLVVEKIDLEVGPRFSEAKCLGLIEASEDTSVVVI
jgi:hypothetical protein